MCKLGIFAWFSYSLPIEEKFKMIKSKGFDAVSLWWGQKDDIRKQKPDLARKNSLEIDNIHIPIIHPNELWADSLDGKSYLEMVCSCIKECAEYTIPVAVCHATGFKDEPAISQIGMERIKRIVDVAEKNEIGIAFENLNFLQHLDYIFQNIQSEYLGFCYDSGHENCFHKDADCLSRYGDKLMAIHIDDNFGNYDSHLLPFDGTVDWDSFKKKLEKCKKLDYLTLEVDFNPNHKESQIYKELSAQAYLDLAYKKALKLL